MWTNTPALRVLSQVDGKGAIKVESEVGLAELHDVFPPVIFESDDDNVFFFSKPTDGVCRSDSGGCGQWLPIKKHSGRCCCRMEGKLDFPFAGLGTSSGRFKFDAVVGCVGLITHRCASERPGFVTGAYSAVVVPRTNCCTLIIVTAINTKCAAPQR